MPVTNASDLSGLAAWTREVLAFTLGASPALPAVPPAEQADLGRELLRALRAVNRKRPRAVVLLGLDPGGLCRALAGALPPGLPCIAVSLDPEAARAVLHDPSDPRLGSAIVLADSSPWALLLLLARALPEPERTLLLVNPAAPDRAALTRLAAVLAAVRPRPLPPAPSAEAITLGAILSPGEPALADFFAALPAGPGQAVVVWDAEAPPPGAMDLAGAAAVRVAHHARVLGNDFAAQRNHLLSLLPAGWTLVLDADERLPEAVAAALPFLVAAAEAAGAEVVAFPRLTLFPDPDHALAGHGLWPDIQPRLFRNSARLAYRRPVHEELTGWQGPLVVCPDLPLLHLSRLQKAPQATRAKLAGFDAASGGKLRHRLAEDYPRQPLAYFSRAGGPHDARVLVLEAGPG